MHKIREIKENLDKLLENEEIIWMLRYRIQWLREGDQNTSLFHTKASTRSRKNKISRIKDSNGVWQEDENNNSSVAISYFKNLFKASDYSFFFLIPC